MFRLLTYYLSALLGSAALLSAIGVMRYDVIDLLFSAAFLVAVAWLVNLVLARVWRVPFNIESSIITGLILSLIITPDKPGAQFFFLLWAASLAVASKYLLAIRGKHIFNPAAFGVALTAMVLGKSATWWVAGNLALLPVVLVGGILVARKIHRWDLVLTYIGTTILASAAFKLGDPSAVWNTTQATVLHTTLLFFAFVMITEPLTTPPRRWQRVIYGGVVGILSAPWAHVGDVYFTPELALLAGNIVSYGLSHKWKSLLVFKEVRTIAADTYEYVFEGATPRFTPGQYAEFTLYADKADNRGNRRYFTFASSPTETGVRLGVKFYAQPSTFKAKLARFSPISTMLAGSIAGDFVLPRNKANKLVFIAGGIGVTPFRSMIKYLIDTKEKRDIVLFYSNKTEGEIAYREIFAEAEDADIGIKVVYTITDKLVASSWQGERGYVNAEMIKRHVPDYQDRYFYVSGPHSMVDGFSKTLRQLGVRRSRMKKDFFPGFA
jgi:ferredoxin-NADP reductase/Na+-translocating ferredoxin:NAD+ oxidoreductase RnfD subunit